VRRHLLAVLLLPLLLLLRELNLALEQLNILGIGLMMICSSIIAVNTEWRASDLALIGEMQGNNAAKGL
jgi:hypothetical protein